MLARATALRDVIASVPWRAYADRVTPPTREEVLAYLRTGGRAFARDYWTQGLPIFFPDRDFGPWIEEDF